MELEITKMIVAGILGLGMLGIIALFMLGIYKLISKQIDRNRIGGYQGVYKGEGK
jgi:hypothetical protein